MQIKSIKAKTIFTSEKKPTVAVNLETRRGVFSASVPAGISTGKFEAKLAEPEKAAANINGIIADAVAGKELSSQQELDQLLLELDASADKSKLGSNALLAVSIAGCRALAASASLPLHSFIKNEGLPFVDFVENAITQGRPSLPKPMVLLIEGGKHSKEGAGRGIDTQEFMVSPQAESFAENFSIAKEVYKTLEQVLGRRFSTYGVLTGAEGGFTPPIEKTEEALDLIMEAVKKAGVEEKVKLALDIASTIFYKENKYHFEGKELGADKLADFYASILEKYPIASIEDPFSEEDWLAWRKIKLKTKSQKPKILIVGDDLTVTNPARIKQAKEKQACNAVIIKPNQIGTVSETIEAAKLAKSFGWQIIVSHRAGETKDDFIADLAVGLGADFIKTGGPEKPERRAKYDRLLEIENQLGQT